MNDLDRAIAIIEYSRQTHVNWADWRRKGNGTDADHEMIGDLEWHENAIRDYDHVLAVLRAAPRAEGLPEPGLDMTPEQTIDWWEQVAYSLGARAERAENTLRDLTQRVAEATIRFPTLTEDTLLRDSFHAASRLIEGVDRE